MKYFWLLAVLFAGFASSASDDRDMAMHRFGVGVTYWTMLDKIDVDNIDENGFSWIFSYQNKPMEILKVELDLEVFNKGFQGIDTTAFAPEAFIVLGSFIYGAAGIGILNANGDFDKTPFYALKAGIDLEIIPRLYLDINLNYRFSKWTSLSEVSEDINAQTLMMGAAVYFEI